jgi:alpha-tubulin suppressor-like RCC1 family protein
VPSLVISDGAPITGMTDIVAGSNHTCARDQGNNVLCWGYNAFGQLGSGNFATTSRPSPVMGLGPADQIQTFSNHTCAIAHGNAYCWGLNSDGQLGDGSTANSDQPQQVMSDLGVMFQAVGTGTNHSCAIDQVSKVWCWGKNDSTQLGVSSIPGSPLPVMTTYAGASSLGLGSNDTCARGSDGSVWCWGSNSGGQLGNGSYTSSTSPVQALPAGMAITVSAGITYACALTTEMSGHLIRCWGINSEGQLGTGNNQDQLVPVGPKLPAGTLVSQLAVGGQETCVLSSDDVPYCWGHNNDSQLGDPSMVNADAPARVPLVCP